MKTTIDYLNEAKERLGIESDYKLAKWLELPRETVSGYRTGRRTIDDYAAVKIAEALNVPPIQIIAAANAEREKDDRKRSFWEQMARGATVGILALGVGGGVAVQDVREQVLENLHNIYYTHKRRSRRWSAAA